MSLPLCRGRVVSLENRKKSWITFKYERLPNICYWCGRLDHSDWDCDIWLESEGSLTNDQKQFGPGLLESPFFPSRRSVVAILGFHKSKRSPSSTSVAHGNEDRSEPVDMSHDELPLAPEPTVVHAPEKTGPPLSFHLRE